MPEPQTVPCACTDERTCDRHAPQVWHGIDPADPAPEIPAGPAPTIRDAVIEYGRLLDGAGFEAEDAAVGLPLLLPGGVAAFVPLRIKRVGAVRVFALSGLALDDDAPVAPVTSPDEMVDWLVAVRERQDADIAAGSMASGA